MSALPTAFPEPSDTDDVLGRARFHAVEPSATLLRALTETERRFGPAVARLGLAAVIFPHAMQKLFGWFGGQGLVPTYHGFTTQLGIPGPLAFLGIALEILAPVALVLGLFTRLFALGVAAVMTGALLVVHLQHGFFMNWTGASAGEGFEYHVLAIALALSCVIAGGGRAALDRALMKWSPMGDRVSDA